jgi:type I restriction enzyme R subunit
MFSADPIAENHRLHEIVTRGAPVKIVTRGETIGTVARLVDRDDAANDWLAANQFEIAGKPVRFPDIVPFLNGLPIVVSELEGAEPPFALDQIETCKAEVPELFRCNLLSVISDGITRAPPESAGRGAGSACAAANAVSHRAGAIVHTH